LNAYADSSFIVSLYVPDSNSTKAIATADLSPAIIASSLGFLETTNAFQLRVFRGQGSPQNAAKALRDFKADIERGVFRMLAVPPSAWTVALRLSHGHSPNLGTRSLDILQVAIAISVRAGTFLTFNRNQAALARAEGLATSLND
jgi:predicted nucleic acid-binding protein